MLMPRMVLGGLLAALLGSSAAHAMGPVELQPMVVRDRVTISVPIGWTLQNAATRQLIAKVGTQLMGQDVGKGADLAVVSTPVPSGMIIRVTLQDTPGEDALSQTDMASEMTRPAAQRQAELDDAMRQMLSQLGKKIPIVGNGKASIVRLGGQLAICMQYRRGDMTQPNTTYWVSQYHVPLGTQKALITLSIRDRDSAQYMPIVQQVLRSVSVR
jgi:hypothetical protein